MEFHSEDQIIHFTDLLFTDFCNKHFGINKGIYNTIENWFYVNGLIDITHRRKTLIYFLQFANVSNRTEQRLKFGHGGLVPKLKDFMEGRKDGQ